MLRLVYDADWVQRKKLTHPQAEEKPEVQDPPADLEDTEPAPPSADAQNP